MALPKYLTTVTPFSKYLALSLFVILPFTTFFIGFSLGKQIGEPAQNIVSQSPSPTLSPKDYITELQKEIGTHEPLINSFPPDTFWITPDGKQHNIKGVSIVLYKETLQQDKSRYGATPTIIQPYGSFKELANKSDAYFLKNGFTLNQTNTYTEQKIVIRGYQKDKIVCITQFASVYTNIIFSCGMQAVGTSDL